MAVKIYDQWLERFSREIGIKSSVILTGNTLDIMCNQNKSGKYEPVINNVVSAIKNKGYESIIVWDSEAGINHKLSSRVPDAQSENSCAKKPVSGSTSYDIGDNLFDEQRPAAKYDSAEDFFSYLLNIMRKGSGQHAFIIDYSDYIFGNANSLSEKERRLLLQIGKALQSQPCEPESDEFFKLGSIVVIIAKNLSLIPTVYYIGNPLVTTLNIPLPGRNERERFVDANILCFNVSQNISRDKLLRDNLIDSLDGFTLKEIAQLMKLSRQLDGERLSFEKLINLYKYGEKISPWEELSKEKLETLENALKSRVKGQDEAVEKAKSVIIRAYTGFSGLQHSAKQKKPKGTLFFVGPTGVGKTELAKAIAEFIFGDENACIRFDMSEFSQEHSDQRLIGAPPGYVGYEAGGQLTNAVKAKPFCVLLFDEIEKAHSRILDKFLQILEDGRLTDSKGETVYFSETVIIFTSNIGASKIKSDTDQDEAKKQFIDAVKQKFMDIERPELLNRIGDNIVAFNFIRDNDVFMQIAEIKFKPIAAFMKERYKAELVFEDDKSAFTAIANAAGKENGGRGLLNVIESKIVNQLSDFVFENGNSLAGRTITIKQYNPSRAQFYFELK